MKAKELMVGDWMIVRDNFRRITTNDIANFSRYMKGVPLTPGILAKNGLCDHHFPEDGDHLLEIYNYADGSIFWTINCAEYEILQLRYVHELQHALRLCGIEKEIEL